MQRSGRTLGLRHPARAFVSIALVTLVLDQISKLLVRRAYLPGESTELVPGVLNLTHVRNVGAAFGLFPGYQPIFIVVSVGVLIVVAAYWRRYRPVVWPVVIALALITGGAIGNLIDRVFLGRVTDFVEVALIDFPVFNVADSGIVVGVGILVAWLLFAPEPTDESARDDSEQSS